jgi:hypothetical protein
MLDLKTPSAGTEEVAAIDHVAVIVRVASHSGRARPATMKSAVRSYRAIRGPSPAIRRNTAYIAATAKSATGKL